MRLLRTMVLIFATVLLGCPTTAAVVEPDEEETEWGGKGETEQVVVVGQPAAVPPQFETGCTPLGDTTELVGVVEMLDFGKGRRGVIIDDGEVKWVVSYNDESVFAEWEKERVLARGRRCDKQGEAIKAYHFEVKSLRLVQ